MGDKQSVKVIEQADFLEPSLKQILLGHMHKIGKEEKLKRWVARWVNGHEAMDMAEERERLFKRTRVVEP